VAILAAAVKPDLDRGGQATDLDPRKAVTGAST
jgi:hypothetical protein